MNTSDILTLMLLNKLIESSGSFLLSKRSDNTLLLETDHVKYLFHEGRLTLESLHRANVFHEASLLNKNNEQRNSK